MEVKQTKRQTTTILLFSFLSLIWLTGCGSSSVPISEKEPARLSAWIAYWDIPAGQRELNHIGKRLQKLSYFAAYFNQDDRLFVPKELSILRDSQKKKSGKQTAYLSFVNDKTNTNGSFLLKDTQVLRNRLADEASMDKHIAEIIDLTRQHGYDGIEIDYEQVWKDDFVWQSFPSFINKLYLAAWRQNLPLRVVLEPGMPFKEAAFAKGPEYVVMLYNLYGIHSEPGPKANAAFIRHTIKRMAALPEQKAIALATGGCSWGSNGEKKFITEQEAKTIAVTLGIDPVRDEASQSLAFTYINDGISYQIWYADAKTLHYWASIAREQGIADISIWRLGGNIDLHKLK